MAAKTRLMTIDAAKNRNPRSENGIPIIVIKTKKQTMGVATAIAKPRKNDLDG